MNEFFEDVRERKELIKGNRHKNHTTAGCKLPYEYLPKKEQANLNGEISTVKLNKPMTWAEFKKLPRGLAEEYLNYLISVFQISASKIGVDMFGLCPSGLAEHIRRRELDVHSMMGKKPTKSAIENWCKWLEGEPSIAPISETTEDSVEEVKPFRAHDYEDMLRECDLSKKDDETSETEPYPYPLQDMGINLEGTPIEVMTTLANAIPTLLAEDKTYRFSIKVDTFFLNHGDRTL